MANTNRTNALKAECYSEKREGCNSLRVLCWAFVKNGRYEIPDLVNYRGFVTTQIRAFVTKNQGYRNEFYRVIVTGDLICTILKHHILNYRHFVMNFTGLS